MHNCSCNSEDFSVNRVFSHDPTRTMTIRRIFENELAKRLRRVSSVAKQLLLAAVLAGEISDEDGDLDVVAFLALLRMLLHREVIGFEAAVDVEKIILDFWGNKFVDTAYEKGIISSNVDLKNAGYIDPYPGVRWVDSITGMAPEHEDNKALLYYGVVAGLKGILDEVHKQVSRALVSGILERKAMTGIVSGIVDRVEKVGVTRAKTLASTELVRSFHIATVQEFEKWGVKEVGVMAEWRTARDSRVCELCRPLEGKIFTISQIRGMIPKHPRCRCKAVPIKRMKNADTDSAGRRR